MSYNRYQVGGRLQCYACAAAIALIAISLPVSAHPHRHKDSSDTQSSPHHHKHSSDSDSSSSSRHHHQHDAASSDSDHDRSKYSRHHRHDQEAQEATHHHRRHEVAESDYDSESTRTTHHQRHDREAEETGRHRKHHELANSDTDSRHNRRSHPHKAEYASIREQSLHNERQAVLNNALHSGSVVVAATAFQGTRYVFGGTSRSGFDCSGFTRYILGQSEGVELPRTAMEQYVNGTKIGPEDMQPGDLVFFKNTYRNGISHVGIYIGNNRFVHACSTKRGVSVDSLDEPYYEKHFAGARRVIEDREASQR